MQFEILAIASQYYCYAFFFYLFSFSIIIAIYINKLSTTIMWTRQHVSIEFHSSKLQFYFYFIFIFRDFCLPPCILFLMVDVKNFSLKYIVGISLNLYSQPYKDVLHVCGITSSVSFQLVALRWYTSWNVKRSYTYNTFNIILRVGMKFRNVDDIKGKKEEHWSSIQQPNIISTKFSI